VRRNATRHLTWWPSIIIASAAAAVLAILWGFGPPLQPVITVWFLLFCPGMAFVRLLAIGDRIAELTLAIALSVALDTLVSETMVLARVWSPTWALVIIAGFSIGGAYIQIRGATDRGARSRVKY
jgi:hypothetical protein